MKYSYFPGCCHHTSALEYDKSTRAVCRELGIEFVDVPDWSCCGSTAAHSTSKLLALALSARNLALAESTGHDVTAACAACYQRLALAHHELMGDSKLRQKVDRVTGREFQGKINVKSILEVVYDVGLDNIEAMTVRPLNGIKAACYYGCLMVRPSSISTDDPENPEKIDNIISAMGGETVNWGHKTECCGASLAVSNEDIVIRLVDRILSDAVKAGANCFVTACPLCHFNLDVRQAKINRKMKTNYRLPVFYFTQLMGVAMGLNSEDLSTNTHFVGTSGLLASLA
ncbi:MAG: CoB--CoM heterodisulfide reductase iron-sulfur subunit B family protein [Bacillota bacterium]